MKELLNTTKCVGNTGKKTFALYRPRTWELKSKAKFFNFHNSLGILNLELTCSVFSINIKTFQNWIRQKLYFGKWVQYVQSFTISDILPSVPAEVRNKYNGVDLSSIVKVDAKFQVELSDQIYVSVASSSVSRQKSSKQAFKSKNITYILKTTRSVGSGRKVK